MKKSTFTRAIVALTIIALLLPCFPVIAAAETPTYATYTPDSSWYGDGTATEFFISTPEQLAYFMQIGIDGTDTFNGKVIKLTSDIIWNDGVATANGFTPSEAQGNVIYKWSPFAQNLAAWKEFRGTFDGQGHSISGLYISATAGKVGFIGQGRGAKLQNLSLVNAYVTTTAGADIAIGIGSCLGDTVLTNVHTSGHVIANKAVNDGVAMFTQAGSLVGGARYKSATFTLTNCTASGSVLGYQMVGGLIGGTFGDTLTDKSLTMTDCINYAAINIPQKGMYVGGIAGYAQADVISCWNYHPVNAPNATYVGGIIGRMECYAGLTMSGLMNEAEIVGKEHVGGLVGSFYLNLASARDVILTDLFNKRNVTASGDYAGGIMGYYYGNSTNSNCTLKATELKNIGNITGNMYVGGLFGYGYDDYSESKIEESSSSGAIKGLCYVGGLAGKLEYIQVLSCSNEGSTVTATGSELVDDTHRIYLGGYLGYGYTIKGCVNDVSLSCEQKGSYVGGIAGYLVGTVSDCENNGTIYAPKATRVAGVIGAMSVSSAITVSELKNNGSITGADHVGGVVGYYHAAFSGAGAPKILSCTNTGAIVATGDYVGGVFGRLYAESTNNNCTLTVIELKNTGSVTGNMYVGGLIGYGYADYAESKIEASTSSGAVKGLCYVGGLAGKLDYIQILSCSNEGSTVTATGSELVDGDFSIYVGGYVGRGLTVKDCVNKVNITCAQQGMYVGGIAGYLTYTASDCENHGKISAPNASRVGGIVGAINPTAASTMSNLKNSGEVTGATRIGGVIGMYYLNINGAITPKISGFTNTAKVTASGDYAGGLVGYFYAISANNNCTLTATELKNTGDVTGNMYVGGLMGYAYDDYTESKLEASTSSGAVKGLCYVGGLFGQIQYIKVINCSNAGSSVSASGYLLENNVYYGFVGGYAGYGYYFSDCVNEITIVYTGGGQFVGGIAGYCEISIEKCQNKGEIKAVNSSYVGGIVGRVGYTNTTPSILNCSNSGAITGKSHVGGIIGEYYLDVNSDRVATFSALTNSGAVTSLGDFAGGIIGRIYANASSNAVHLKMTELKNNGGQVMGLAYVGGLVGYGYSDASDSYMEACTSTNAYVQGSYYVGGLGGYLYPISMNNCSNEGSTITATGSVLVDNSYYAAYLGGYAGYGSAATKCENKSSLNYVGEGAYVGGIMGFAVGNLTECKNSGNISAVKSNYVGGIAGYCSNTGSAAHKTLTNTGSVKGMGHVGGLFGMLKCNTSSGSTLTLSALTNEGSVRATEEYAGGLFGELYANASSNSCTVTATAFTNTGNVVGTKTVGGLIGKFYSDTSASTLTGYSSTGGVTASEGTSDALIATLQNLVLK